MKNDDKNYPADHGFRMPAEWEIHAGTLLIWPHNRDTWPGKRLDAVETVYKKIIRTLLKYEPVVLLVANDEIKKRAASVLGDTSSLRFPLHIHRVPVNDVWARDSGPIFIKQREKETYRLTNWEFNSWGGKYEPWDDDNRIPEYISTAFSIPAYSTEKILEGGSIETNGEGLFLTTESVLLNPNRNPGLSKAEAEQMLKRYLGAEKVIWLKRGLKGDDTDGHVDDLTRFINKNTVITALTEDNSNPNHDILYENLEILLHSSDLTGNPLHVITVPLPNTRIEDATVDGSVHVPSSYANFYLANGAVLVPLYDSRTDQQVLDLFSALFPNREIEGITCNDLVWGQGSIHCITQQLFGVSLE